MLGLFVFLTLNTAFALQPIPMTGLGLPAGTMAPIEVLKEVTQTSQFQTCRSDLEQFLAALTPEDEKELDAQRSAFDSKKLSAMLLRKKKYLWSGTEKDISINPNMKSGHFFIAHGKLKCRISIYTEMENDGVKSNVDPASADVKITERFSLDATLVGSSADAKKNATARFDPSCLLTTLKKLDVSDQKTQIRILEEFQKWESTSTARPSLKPPR